MQAFHLPSYQHIVAEYSTNTLPASGGRDKFINAPEATLGGADLHIDYEEQMATPEDDSTMNDIAVVVIQTDAPIYNGTAPLSMQELADVAGQRTLEDTTKVEGVLMESMNGAETSINNRNGSTKIHLPNPKTKGSSKKRTREESEKASPTKKAKAANASIPVPTPTRVLRPRASKSATQVEEEKKMERAYRKAIAE